jgi:hypothetical protein
MHGGHEPNLFLDALLLIIITAYFGIAFQFWTRRRIASGRATTALAQLVVIFVFCAICGYLPRLIDIPLPLLLTAHIVLAVSAWTYLFAGQVDRLSVAVDFADSGAQTQRLTDADLDAETEACARLAEQLGSKVTAQMIRDRLACRRDAGPASAASTESSAVAV